MIKYRVVDIKERQAHLDYFMSLNSPHTGITAKVDVTDVLEFCHKNKYSFFLVCAHILALAADEVPQFRRRIHVFTEEEKTADFDAIKMEGYADALDWDSAKQRGYEVREYEACPSSHTENTGGENYCYCTLHHDKPLKEYLEYAMKAQARARCAESIEEDEEVEGYYFFSCLPWLSFTEVLNPMAGAFDSNPRISWGKYEEDFRGRQMMPVSVVLHHGLADGKQMAAFFENIGIVAEKLMK